MGTPVNERVAKHRARKRQERLATTSPDWEHVALHLNRMPLALRKRLSLVTHTGNKSEANSGKTVTGDSNRDPIDWQLVADNIVDMPGDLFDRIAPWNITAKLRRMRKEERDYEKAIRHEAVQEMYGRDIRKQFDEMNRRLNAYNALIEAGHHGALTKTEFKSILSCCHPDRRPDDDRLNKAFDLLKKKESILVRPDPDQRIESTLPGSVEEMLRRQKTKTV